MKKQITTQMEEKKAMTTQAKLQTFAELLEKQQIERLTAVGISYDGFGNSVKVRIVPGRKYTKVNVGCSGKYMVDKDGHIWGIKAYGQIHHGHHYGTLDTINDYYWGDYTAYKLKKN